jgi:Mn2+/Fe2+ NRAMP family transporter
MDVKDMEKWVIIIVIAILTAFAAQKAQAQPHSGQTTAARTEQR